MYRYDGSFNCWKPFERECIEITEDHKYLQESWTKDKIKELKKKYWIVVLRNYWICVLSDNK